MTDRTEPLDAVAMLAALAGTVRTDFDTDKGVDRWTAVVVLSVLDHRRIEPSDWQLALVRFLVRCDLRNLRRMYAVEPEYVRAVVMWQYLEGGADQLRHLAADGSAPIGELPLEAERLYRSASRAGDHLDAKLSAGLPVHLELDGEDRAAYNAVAACAAAVPRLTGALARAAESRWQGPEQLEVLVVRAPDAATYVSVWRDGRDISDETAVAVVDPGWGHTPAEWQELMDAAAADEAATPAFRAEYLKELGDWRPS